MQQKEILNDEQASEKKRKEIKGKTNKQNVHTNKYIVRVLRRERGRTKCIKSSYTVYVYAAVQSAPNVHEGDR